VDLYEVSESFRDGSTLARTFHVYRPARASGRVPALVTLHGGHGTGVRFLEQFAPLADARGDTGITWEKNRSLCFYTHPDGFQTPGGAPCTPTEATVYNAQPFLLVMPDGIFDEGSTSSRHWEDGRVPSPGSTQVAERRDDVGFLNHIVGVLRAHPSVDPTRIYVAGVSNGGMMVQRLACSMESPDYPNLARVAAWGSFVASMTEPVFDGSDGRPRCPRTGTLARPVAFFVGTGIDTPYCATEQVCTEPLTGDGDGIVVYGSAGGRYCLAGASEGGCTVAVPDSAALWTSFHAAWGAASTNDLTIGLFTQARHTTFADTQARVTVLTTDGGAHTTGSSRHDFEPWARMWAFLSSFSRDASGQVSASLPTHVEGEY
jgi:poly(3-hydroxybutyrate) depolymerase